MINKKQKGNRGERELAEFLKEHGLEARRTVQYSAGTPDSSDITSNLDNVFIECKRTERTNMHDWIIKATQEAGEDKMPVVFWRKDDSFWVGVLRGSDMVKLLRMYNKLENILNGKEKQTY